MQPSIYKKCAEKKEENFDKIEAYLRKYPNSNALQVAEGTGIEVYEIVCYLKEGRLNQSSGEFSRL